MPFTGLLLNDCATDAHETVISADRLYAWMTALGQLRLVIGTRIGVTEDTEPDDSPEFALYGYLSYLQEQVVEAMSTTL